MKSSILNSISEFARNNNLPFDQLSISFTLFPDEFYYTIIEYVKEVRNKYDDSIKITDFRVIFDKEKNAYFEFIGNGNTNLTIIQEGINYDYLPPSYKVKENDFFSRVVDNDIEKNKKILNSLPEEFKDRFVKYDNFDIYKMLEEGKDEIIRYINFFLERYRSVETIYFNEADLAPQTHHIKRNNINTKDERKNDEISFEDREEVLDSYNSEFDINANATNSDSKYKVKVYKIEGKYRLVMEPILGTKYTKVVYIDKEKLDYGDAKEIVIDTLELSRTETTNRDDITRHSHTTLEGYKNLLEYILNNKDNGLSANTKISIDKASNIKR